jgi:hypothetical protein
MSWVKRQFDPLGQLPFSQSRQSGLRCGGGCWNVGSCSCVGERGVVCLCWGLGATVGGPDVFRPCPCGLRWGMFGLPRCSGTPVRGVGRFGCGVGMFVKGTEPLRVVLGFCGFCGIVGDVGGSVLTDEARFVRGRRGGSSR